VPSAQYFTHAASINYKNTACNFKTTQIDSQVYLYVRIFIHTALKGLFSGGVLKFLYKLKKK
jgi:hypothetical protein